MRRRAFTKAISSLLVVPLLKFQPATIDRHRLLGMFLDDEESFRYDLTRPYVVGDYSYATDGYIMARIETNESEHDDETIKVPPVESVWETLFHAQRQWSPFKLAEHDQLIATEKDEMFGGTCPMCDDRRVSFGASYPTDETTADELPEYDPDDNTIRDANCPLCRGKPYRKGSQQRVGELLIAYRYAKKLAEIPGCEINLGRCTSFLKGSVAFPSVLFRSEIGISGIISPISEI